MNPGMIRVRKMRGNFSYSCKSHACRISVDSISTEASKMGLATLVSAEYIKIVMFFMQLGRNGMQFNINANIWDVGPNLTLILIGGG